MKIGQEDDEFNNEVYLMIDIENMLIRQRIGSIGEYNDRDLMVETCGFMIITAKQV